MIIRPALGAHDYDGSDEECEFPPTERRLSARYKAAASSICQWPQKRSLSSERLLELDIVAPCWSRRATRSLPWPVFLSGLRKQCSCHLRDGDQTTGLGQFSQHDILAARFSVLSSAIMRYTGGSGHHVTPSPLEIVNSTSGHAGQRG